MPAHVYECQKQDAEKLKKLLAYDPYLDPEIIPPSVPGSDKPASKLTDDERKAIEERDRKVKEGMERLNADKYHDVIFARQEYQLIDGSTFGKQDVTYLYLKAADDFLERADEALPHKLPGVKRCDGSTEQEVIAKVAEQEGNADSGFGSIFG